MDTDPLQHQDPDERPTPEAPAESEPQESEPVNPGPPSDAAPEDDEASGAAPSDEPAAGDAHGHDDSLIGGDARPDIDLSFLQPSSDGDPEDEEEPDGSEGDDAPLATDNSSETVEQEPTA